MKLLLDTHVVIWAIASSRRLGHAARSLIADPSNDIYVSAITVAEIAVKYSLGKESAPPFSGTEARYYCSQAGYALLDMTAQHAARLDTLPPKHKDPFDRMLVAQALTEPLRLVTHDMQVAAYDHSIILI